MKDSERLELLKEIAGTRTYDDRRKESLKIMKDTDNRLEQITEVTRWHMRRVTCTQHLNNVSCHHVPISCCFLCVQVITSLEKRLSELDSEKSELREFQKLDTTRRSLEYTVSDGATCAVRDGGMMG